jgi:hypothetical protein
MNKKTFIFLIIGIVIVAAALVYYFFSDTLHPKIRNFVTEKFYTKTYNFSGNKFSLINNSKKVSIKINDQKKLEQIIRRYSNLYSRYQGIELTIEDEPQEMNFSWEDGSPFGYTINSKPDPILKLSLKIDIDLLNKYQWPIERVATESEYTLLNALERADMNLDPEKKVTRSGVEELEKVTIIEDKALKASEELYTDNQTELFEIKLL